MPTKTAAFFCGTRRGLTHFLPSINFIPRTSVLQAKRRSSHKGGGSRLVSTTTTSYDISSNLTQRSLGSLLLQSCTAKDCLPLVRSTSHPLAHSLRSHTPQPPHHHHHPLQRKKVKFSFVPGSVLCRQQQQRNLVNKVATYSLQRKGDEGHQPAWLSTAWPVERIRCKIHIQFLLYSQYTTLTLQTLWQDGRTTISFATINTAVSSNGIYTYLGKK